MPSKQIAFLTFYPKRQIKRNAIQHSNVGTLDFSLLFFSNSRGLRKGSGETSRPGGGDGERE